MSNKGPAQAVARAMLFVLLVASGAAMLTATTGNPTGAMQICGAGIGAALLIALLGAIFVVVAKRSME